MDYNSIKKNIQELAAENFRLYPENYLANEEGAENVSELAKSYFKHRTDEEVERDNENNIDLDDYIEFCQEEFDNYLNIE